MPAAVRGPDDGPGAVRFHWPLHSGDYRSTRVGMTPGPGHPGTLDRAGNDESSPRLPGRTLCPSAKDGFSFLLLRLLLVGCLSVCGSSSGFSGLLSSSSSDSSFGFCPARCVGASAPSPVRVGAREDPPFVTIARDRSLSRGVGLVDVDFSRFTQSLPKSREGVGWCTAPSPPVIAGRPGSRSGSVAFAPLLCFLPRDRHTGRL